MYIYLISGRACVIIRGGTLSLLNKDKVPTLVIISVLNKCALNKCMLNKCVLNKFCTKATPQNFRASL